MTQKMYCGLVFLQHFIVTKGTQEESNQFLQLCLKIGSPEDLMNRLILINTPNPISKLAISRQLYHVNPCYTPIFKHQTPFAAQAARPSISGGASAGAVPKAWLSEGKQKPSRNQIQLIKRCPIAMVTGDQIIMTLVIITMQYALALNQQIHH